MAGSMAKGKPLTRSIHAESHRTCCKEHVLKMQCQHRKLAPEERGHMQDADNSESTETQGQ